MDVKQNMEKQLRQSFQNAYKQRLLTMKNFYEMRYQTLQQTVSTSYRKVLQDEILTTMVRDTTTVTYIEERVRELFKQIIQNQREVLIEKLGLQYSQLKFHYQEVEKKYNTLKKETEGSQQKTYRDRINSESEKFEISESLRKKDHEINELKLEIKENQMTIRDKERTIKDLQSQVIALNAYKNENSQLKLQLERFEMQVEEVIGVQKTKFELKDVDLQQSQKKVNLLQHTVKQMEKANQEKIELIQKKYRKKIGDYKDKIQEYKAKILELINQKSPDEGAYHRQIKIQELEKKIVLANRQSEKKISEFKALKEKERVDMEKKYEIKYRELQTYYEKIMEEKIEEAQKVAYEAADRIKTQEQEIKKYVSFMEQNSVTLEEYNKVCKFCEDLKGHLANKILENQKATTYLESQNKHLTGLVQQAERNSQQANSKIANLDAALNDARNKLKQYEQQLMSMKNNQKKLKTLLSDLQNNLEQKSNQNLTLRNQIQKLRNQTTEHLGTIGERENLFLQKSQQHEQLQRRVSKFVRDVETLQQEIQKHETTNNQLKKILTQKQNKIMSMNQDYQFKFENMNSQLQKYSLTCDSLNMRVKQLVDKCAALETENSENVKSRVEFEAIARKLQLENKFVKQSEENFRLQHEAYISDFKKRLEEKNTSMESLQANYYEQKKKNTELSQAHEVKIRKMATVLKKVHRIYSNQIQNLNRNLKDIRIYIESFDKLIISEFRMIENSANLKIKQEIKCLISVKNDQIRKAKQILQHEKSQHLDATKTKSQQLEIGYKQKLESEIRNYETLISSKDKQIQRLEKQRKKQASQKDDLYEINRNSEKKLKDIELAFQNEKIQSRSKLTQIMRNFENQKGRIVSEFEAKRDKQQQEIQQLTKAVKAIRKQLEVAKNTNQQLKNKMQSEHQTLNKKQRDLERELQRKKLEVENLNQQVKNLRESTFKLDHELKTVFEKNNAISIKLAEAELTNHQSAGELVVSRVRLQRLTEEMEQLKRELSERQAEKVAAQQSKRKTEYELKQIKSTITKSNKSHELKAIQQLGMETKQLTSKVKQLKQIGLLVNQELTPLRS